MTDTPSQKHVFISYSRRDEAVMRSVVEFLRKQGITVWVDNEKLVPGTPIWEEEIEKAIHSASAVVVILSPDSKKSVWVRREISFAERYYKRIFPVMVAGDEDSSITLRLITSQYVDIRENEEIGLNSLKVALSFYLEEIEVREKAEREAAEKAAREKVERETAEKAAKEKVESEAAEKAAREQAEKETAEKVALEEAKHDTAEKSAHEEVIRETVQKDVQEEHRQEVFERTNQKWTSPIAITISAVVILIVAFILGNSLQSGGNPPIPPTNSVIETISATPVDSVPESTSTPTLTGSTINTSTPLDNLITAAQTEGELNVIALPHDWANYGEIIDTFKSKYGLTVNELDPSAGSADELAAIETNKDSKGPQAPDAVDVGVGHTANAMAKGLFAKYKVSTWDSIEMKDPDGYWWAEYYGALAFEVSKPEIENSPQDWEDLLKPEYKGKVAMAGDVLKSNQAVMTVFAAGLSRAGGDKTKAAEMGLQFWKEMNDAGNFIPVIADWGTIAQGETPIVIEWDYLALANRDALAGNLETEIIVPKTGVIAGPYAGAISAYAPHPYAARLWWEFVMSDEGQLLYLKGYAHPIRYNDMVKRGVIPADLAAKLPPAEAYANAVFLSVDELQAATTYITENWRSVVFGE